ncbi:MAG: dihydroorotate dehydrogenase (quinone), partial [Anaerolineales bacterium]|nr:dihydroorotate dehydrogenase (quinone) [Anaerolineales bacterium]
RAEAQASGARLGVNLGKGKDTPLERAAEDYTALVRRYAARADYLAVNISSPNTPALRQLQTRTFITGLLRAVTAERDRQPVRVPVLVKIAPDLSEPEIDDVLDAVSAANVDGLIATNTTLSREGLPDFARRLAGGLSGAPLRDRATAVIAYLARRTHGRLPIVGVGGIMTPDDALAKLDAGAVLIQLYTGLVYAGPGLARAINRRLLARR